MNEKIEVTGYGNGVYSTDKIHYSIDQLRSAREIADHYAAIADFIDAEREAAEVAELEALKAKIEAEKKLDARRDAIAFDLTNSSYGYGVLSGFAQRAIDRIIELENTLMANADRFPLAA